MGAILAMLGYVVPTLHGPPIFVAWQANALMMATCSAVVMVVELARAQSNPITHAPWPGSAATPV
ncbi:MAG TPA: hypothetical protein VGR22_00555 [Thermomicrobiales bacterium]|nr:hypothetical protein [Thermomicrobiales bacterium]